MNENQLTLPKIILSCLPVIGFLKRVLKLFGFEDEPLYNNTTDQGKLTQGVRGWGSPILESPPKFVSKPDFDARFESQEEILGRMQLVGGIIFDENESSNCQKGVSMQVC